MSDTTIAPAEKLVIILKGRHKSGCHVIIKVDVPEYLTTLEGFEIRSREHVYARMPMMQPRGPEPEEEEYEEGDDEE